MKRTGSEWIALAVIIILMGMLYLTNSLSLFHHLIYDHFYEAENSATSKIVIVGIDDLTYTEVGRWPLSREIQSDLFNKILKDQPAVLGIDILYDSNVSEVEDQTLIDTLQGKNVVVAKAFSTNSLELVDQNQSMIAPFEALNAVVASGYINTEPNSVDGVVRTIALKKHYYQEEVFSFDYKIVEAYAKAMAPKNIEARLAALRLNESLYIDYAGSSGTYDVISAYEVLDERLPDGYFEDRIVLFGPYAVGMQDNYTTPLDKVTDMYGVEVHANIIQNLLDDSFRVNGSPIVVLLLIPLFGIISFFLSKKITLTLTLIANGLLILIISVAGKLAFTSGSVYEIIYPIGVVLLVTIVMMAYRYIEQLVEKRRITQIFGKYVAPQIVDKILEAGEEHLKLGGDKKEITVLFVDIRGFTPLSEVASPEEVVEILNNYLELCSNAIFNHDGTLDKFIGDAAMAIFNAPTELEDHAYRAVQTAWEMKTNGEKLKQMLFERFGKEVAFGIGINTGEAIVGNIGSSARMDYTAIGDTVNIASRLEGQAKPGQILISKATFDAVQDKITSTSLGKVSVKGKENNIEVYQVEGLLP